MGEIHTFAGFRAHILREHDFVGSIIDGKPTFHGLDIDADGVFSRNGEKLFQLRTGRTNSFTRVEVKTFVDLWFQEMGLTVKVIGNGLWRGIGPHGKWTKTSGGVEGWLAVKQRDARLSTIHFDHFKYLDSKHNIPNPQYTIGVEYREKDIRWRFFSDCGFADLLNEPVREVPWPGCQVFDEDYKLAGYWLDPSGRPLRRLELAGHPTQDADFWMHFISWAGGAGAVVQKSTGRADHLKSPERIDHLYHPPSWRLVKAGRKISSKISMRKLQPKGA